jgi:Rrf2 family protein
VEILAKTDYAVRAMLGLAEKAPALVKIDALIAEQQMPRKFLESILVDLRRAGLVRTQRGADGGYALAQPAPDITIAAIIRAVDGPLAEVRGQRPEDTTYVGVAAHLPQVWVAVRAALRRVLDETTLQQVLDGDLPEHVREMVTTPGAWQPR